MPLTLPTLFSAFISSIRTSDSEMEKLKRAHILLRDRLTSHPSLKDLIFTTFIQGSYRRRTSLQPIGGKRSDVDVVVVTKLPESVRPKDALAKFAPFVERYYPDKGRAQARSIGIHTESVDMDLVITSAPSVADEELIEAIAQDDDLDNEIPWRSKAVWAPLLKAARQDSADWKISPLRIPDCSADCWEDTHPIAQLEWTSAKNESCNGHFSNIVRALKWWKYNKHPTPSKPRSYPLERMIAECCPDGITSIAEGIAATLHNMARRFTKVRLPLFDHGTQCDVLQRITDSEFYALVSVLPDAARTAQRAIDAASASEAALHWQALFGKQFPDPSSDDGGGEGGRRFTRRESSSDPDSGRFA